MSLRTRTIVVAVVALLALGLAYPSFFSETRRLESDWIPDQGMNLGLDLQGGIHWLLGIDREKALGDELENARRRLEEVLQRNDVAFGSLDRDGERLVVTGVNPDAIAPLVDRDFEGMLDLDEIGGGVELTLSEPWKRDVIERGVRQVLDVLDRRINAIGVREPVIAPQGEGRVLVQLPGGDVDPRTARKMISETTFLEFKKVLDAAETEELLRARYPEGAPEDTEFVVRRSGDAVVEALLVQNPAILSGAMLEDARLAFNARTNEPIVSFTWNPEGTEIFREFTSENIQERMAAILDGECITAPVIQARIGRRGQIEGSFTQQEAADLAVALRSGALPIPLVIEEERTVGPALGADSIANGIRSILIGGVGVIVFMAIYYSVSGVLANVALLLNILIIIGLMSLAQATLTLPGIAGLVLTVGMAVDANVIIFERIREELRTGKALRNAVQIGFNRSRLTILDANITTMIAALILYYYGRGPVQGFGVTLGIGILSSVFCALVVTRLFVELVSRRSEQLRI